MDWVILEKIECSILNGLGYIVCLEKKNGSKKYRDLYFLRFTQWNQAKWRLNWCEPFPAEWIKYEEYEYFRAVGEWE